MHQNTPKALYSVSEFCCAHGIARSHFYALLKEGRAPAIIKLGRRTLISTEAAAAWRRRLESEAAPGCVHSRAEGFPRADQAAGGDREHHEIAATVR